MKNPIKNENRFDMILSFLIISVFLVVFLCYLDVILWVNKIYTVVIEQLFIIISSHTPDVESSTLEKINSCNQYN